MLSVLAGVFRLGFAEASHVGWLIIAGCGVAVFTVGAITSGRWARATAERTASALMPAPDESPGQRALTGPAPGGRGQASAAGGWLMIAKGAPWLSLTTAIRPNGVSHGAR